MTQVKQGGTIFPQTYARKAPIAQCGRGLRRIQAEVTMPPRRPRPCLDCGRLTRNPSRCDDDQAVWEARHNRNRGSATQRGYDSTWRKIAAAAVAKHRKVYGNWCPGWQVDPHPAKDLTADHIVPKTRGGSSTSDNVQVLCRGCNSRKRDHQT